MADRLHLCDEYVHARLSSSLCAIAGRQGSLGKQISSNTVHLQPWSRASASSCETLDMHVLCEHQSIVSHRDGVQRKGTLDRAKTQTRTRMSKVLKPLLVAIPSGMSLGLASITLIWKSPLVSSYSRTTRVISSTSVGGRRGAVTLRSCDMRRAQRCHSSPNARAHLRLSLCTDTRYVRGVCDPADEQLDSQRCMCSRD